MFKIKGQTLLVDDIEVLEKLKEELHKRGIERFAQFKDLGDNIMTNCPFHKDGQERRPSCGITTEDKGSTPSGTVHCLACKYTSSLAEMISRLFGFEDQGVVGEEWLVQNFVSFELDARGNLDMTLKPREAKDLSMNYVPNEELVRYRNHNHPYLQNRGVGRWVQDLFDTGYDHYYKVKTEWGDRYIPSVTFPVRDATGGVLFLSRRSVEGKFFSLPTNIEKPLYGEYEVRSIGLATSRLVVVESQINTLTCFQFGDLSVALFGTGTEEQIEMLLRMPQREIILALDPDKAGRSATRSIKKRLQVSKIVGVMKLPPKKDINDLSYQEYLNLEIEY